MKHLRLNHFIFCSQTGNLFSVKVVIITNLNCIIAKLWLIHEEYRKENLPTILKNTRPLQIQFHNFEILMGSSEWPITNLTDYAETGHQDACR